MTVRSIGAALQVAASAEVRRVWGQARRQVARRRPAASPQSRLAPVEALEARQLLSAVSGHVYVDANANGSRDAGEAGSGGWTVYLDGNDNGSLDGGEASRVTGPDGGYAFGGLRVNASYHVRAVSDAPWPQTQPAGGDGGGGGGRYVLSVDPAHLTLTGNDFGLRPPPAAPTGLEAAAASTSEIDLAWANNDPAAELQVERTTLPDDGGAYTVLGMLPAGTTSYPDTGVDEGRAYRYRVSAVNGPLSSTPAEVAVATPPRGYETGTGTIKNRPRPGFHGRRAPHAVGGYAASGTLTPLMRIAARGRPTAVGA